MKKHTTFRKVIAAAVVSTAIGLTSLVGGTASAEGPSLTGASAPKHNVPMLYQALTKNESMPATGQVIPSKNVVPQQAGNDRPTEELAFYYNRIAFNYAASK